MAGLSAFFKSEAAQTVRREGREEGRVEKQAQNIVSALEHRGVVVPESVRERVLACQDRAVLEVWWERAFKVTEAADLFAADASAGSED